MTWDPGTYLRFGDERLRPGIDLLARVPDIAPRLVIDLGCGAGNLTAVIAERFPTAHVVGLDSSAKMIEAARTLSAPVEWVVGGVEEWEPAAPFDLVFSNATLHWVDDHASLFGALRHRVGAGGVLAVQMPDNWDQPTHRVPAAVLATGEFGDDARRALLTDRVASPADYRRWIGPHFDIDTWSTTYFHVLGGADPVVEWVSGSLLRPVLEVLSSAARTEFLDRCAAGYRRAYPPEPDGSTVLGFRRLFIVARRR